MSGNRPRNLARPFAATIRRMMMMVAYFAVIFAVAAPLFRQPGQNHALAVSRAALLLSPWLLACLIGMFETPGPIKSWALLCVLFLFYPAIAGYVDVTFAVTTWKTGNHAGFWTLLGFNALIGGSAFLFFRHMAPVRCPSCASRALIPLVRLGGQSVRLSKTRWCGACGGLYWRDRQGEWRVEHRTTWITSAPDQPATPHLSAASGARDSQHPVHPVRESPPRSVA